MEGTDNENNDSISNNINTSQEHLSDSTSDVEVEIISRAGFIINETYDFIKQILKSLSCLMEFKSELLAAYQDNDIIEKMNDVFSDIEQLQMLYNLMFNKIASRKSEGSICIADLFLDVDIRSSLEIYRTFLSQYSTNAKWIGDFVKENEIYYEICTKLNKKNDGSCQNIIHMDSCYYTVFNSLFAFSLLLNRYTKCFDDGHESQTKGEEVQNIISDLLNDINVNQQSIFITQKELSMLTGKSKDPKINSKYIFKGNIMMLSKKYEKVSRQLILFSDCLFLTFLPGAITGTSKIREELSLNDMIISVINQTDNSMNNNLEWGLNITSPEGFHDFYFESESVMRKWKMVLQSAIKNCSKIDIIKTSELGKISPCWQKDSATIFCNGWMCNHRFSHTVRRHHCRADGLLYCDSCCSYKIKLPFPKSSESKVCQLCYRILYKDLSQPSKLDDAKKTLQNVFDLKTRKGIKIGWLEERVFNREKYLFNSPAKFFCELDAKHPYLKVYEKNEDKYKHHGVMLLGMVIKKDNSSRNFKKLKPTEFIIEHQDKDEAYLYRASSEEICKEWVKCLEESITNYVYDN